MPKNIKDSELILGIIATVGTDTKGVIKDISGQLEFFKYTTEEIVVSKQIISQFELKPSSFENEYERISHYMNLGNKIRAASDDMKLYLFSRYSYRLTFNSFAQLLCGQSWGSICKYRI